MTTPEVAVGVDVTVTPPDRREHSRTPGYVGNRRGAVVDARGRHPLPSSVVRGEPVDERLFSVRFDAQELFGDGDHCVHVDLYESALTVTHGR